MITSSYHIMMTSLHHMIIWQCDQDPVSYSVTEVFHYIGRLSRIFFKWKNNFAPLFWTSFISFFSFTGPKMEFLSIRPYSVTCRYFPALLLLDKKVWEVAQYVFCYCLYTNLSHFQRFCSSFNESKPHFSMSHCTERYRSEEISPHVSSTCKV